MKPKIKRMEIYKTKISVMDAKGDDRTFEDYQNARGLEGFKIGKYFSVLEWRFKQDIEDNDALIVCWPLMVLLDEFREQWKKPVRISSFNRSIEKQEELRRRGYKAAKFSPHVVKMAADIDLKDESEVREAVTVMRRAAKLAGVACRIGWRTYLPNQSFIHVDVCPEYYSKGRPFHNLQHPKVWESQIEW